MRLHGSSISYTLGSKPKYLHTSASQIKSFENCKRFWFYNKVMGLETPSTPAQERGKKIHKAVEQYLKGEKYDEDYEPFILAVKNVILGPIEGIETRVDMPTYQGGPGLVGYVDLLQKNLIGDYKSTSDFKYRKTQDELLVDIQLNTYAFWWYQSHDANEWLDLRHIYLLAKKDTTPKASVVNVTTSYEQVEKVWLKTLDTVRAMSATIESCYRPPADDDDIDLIAQKVAPTTSFCEAYGGCHFRTRCGLSPDSPLTMNWLKAKGKKEFTSNDVQPDVQGKSMSLKDKLLAQQAAKSAAAPTNGVTTTPAQPTGPSLEEKLAKNAPVAEEISALDSKLAALSVQVESLPDATVTVSIVPPDAAPDAVDIAQADAPAATTTVIVDPPAKKPVGRPKKNTEAAAPQAEGLCLYIDCFPVKGPHKNSYVLAEDWLKPIAEQVAQDSGQADWRLIQFTAKPQLAIAVRARLTELPASMVVMTFAAGSDVLLECLIPYAVQVIRGK